MKAYYTLEMFKADTGKDYKKKWKEAFIDKSTNFLETGEPTSSETVEKSDNSLAHELYQKAKNTGQKISDAATLAIIAKADAKIKTAAATAVASIPKKIKEYISKNAITLDQAVQQVTTPAEDQKSESQDKTNTNIKKEDELSSADNNIKKSKNKKKRDKKLNDDLDKGDKKCADGPDKVVSLINNAITEHIEKTKAQEELRIKEAQDAADATVEAIVANEGEKAVTLVNQEMLEIARSKVAIENKIKKKVKIIADKTSHTVKLKLAAILGL